MIQRVHNLIVQSEECSVDAGLVQERRLSHLHGAAVRVLIHHDTGSCFLSPSAGPAYLSGE
jgi:hypothetical protein